MIIHVFVLCKSCLSWTAISKKYCSIFVGVKNWLSYNLWLVATLVQHVSIDFRGNHDKTIAQGM